MSARASQRLQLATRDGFLMEHARILAVVPLGEAVFRAPELIGHGLYLTALQETGTSVLVCLGIAATYRLVNWIMNTDQRSGSK